MGAGLGQNPGAGLRSAGNLAPPHERQGSPGAPGHGHLGSTWHKLSRGEEQVQLGLAFPQELLRGQASLQAGVLDEDPRCIKRLLAHHLFLAAPSARAVSLQLWQIDCQYRARYSSGSLLDVPTTAAEGTVVCIDYKLLYSCNKTPYQPAAQVGDRNLPSAAR